MRGSYGHKAEHYVFGYVICWRFAPGLKGLNALIGSSWKL